MKILEFYSLVDAQEVWLANAANLVCTRVIDSWRQFMERCSRDLPVTVMDCLPLLESRPGGEFFNIPSNVPNVVNAAIAATPAASANAPKASMEICFCYLDAPTMDLVKLVCCKKTIHWQ
jgi:hypothetical protein